MRPGLRFKVLTRDNYTCRYCGAKAPDVKLHVDHVVPKSAGGRDELGNLVTACQACNLGKHASLTEQSLPDLDRVEFWERLREQEERAMGWFRHGSALIEDEFSDLTGRACTRRECLVLNELLLLYGDHLVLRGLRRLAERAGFGESAPCLCIQEEMEHSDTCSRFVDVDLFELRQMMRRWRLDGVA